MYQALHCDTHWHTPLSEPHNKSEAAVRGTNCPGWSRQMEKLLLFKWSTSTVSLERWIYPVTDNVLTFVSGFIPSLLLTVSRSDVIMFVCVCVSTVTIVTVSDAVLKHSMPLLLLLLCHHAEVVVAGVWVPQDEGELGRTLDKWITARFAFSIYKSHERTRR